MFAHQMILLVQLTSNMMIRIHLNFHGMFLVQEDWTVLNSESLLCSFSG